LILSSASSTSVTSVVPQAVERGRERPLAVDRPPDLDEAAPHDPGDREENTGARHTRRGREDRHGIVEDACMRECAVDAPVERIHDRCRRS
jgi:hypothetical protein